LLYAQSKTRGCIDGYVKTRASEVQMKYACMHVNEYQGWIPPPVSELLDHLAGCLVTVTSQLKAKHRVIHPQLHGAQWQAYCSNQCTALSSTVCCLCHPVVLYFDCKPQHICAAANAQCPWVARVVLHLPPCCGTSQLQPQTHTTTTQLFDFFYTTCLHTLPSQ
jgi:hypothetical protein